MIALNSALEAERAGDYGKTFAVVAFEISKLASQSQLSVEGINQLVADIQVALISTATVTNEGTKTVDKGVQIAYETAEAFTAVADAINNIVINSHQISLTANQQAVAIKQVLEAMSSLNLAASQTADGISRIKEGSETLNETATQLKSMV